MTTMNSWLPAMFAAVIGLCAGMVFFGGLWLTVALAVTVRRRLALFAASFFLRAAAVLAGFYAVVTLDWRLLPAAFIGFLCMRFVIVRALMEENRGDNA